MGELLHKLLKPSVFGNHEGCDRYLELAALGGKGEGLVDDLAVESPAIFVIAGSFLDAGGLAVGDHKDLLVGILAATEEVHREFQTCNGVGMVWAYVEVWEVFDLYLPSIVAKDDDVEGVFGVAGSDELGEGHGCLLGGGDAVLAIEDHGMGDVDHEDCAALAFVVLLYDLKVVFGKAEAVEAVVDLGIAEGVGHGDVLKGIAKLVGAAVCVGLVAEAADGGAVATLLAALELAKDLFEGVLADGLLGLACEPNFAVFIFADVTFLLELVCEVPDAVAAGGDVVFAVDLSKPVEGFGHVAVGVDHHLEEDVQQLFEGGFVALRGDVVRKAVADHIIERYW